MQICTKKERQTNQTLGKNIGKG